MLTLGYWVGFDVSGLGLMTTTWVRGCWAHFDDSGLGWRLFLERWTQKWALKARWAGKCLWADNLGIAHI